MPAPKRIPDRAIQEAMAKWRGNVQAAADELGIARNNLYKRLAVLGYRSQTAGSTGTRRIGQIVRLESEQQARLREAKFDLMARERVEMDEGLVMRMFFSDCFEPWLRSKLEPQP